MAPLESMELDGAPPHLGLGLFMSAAAEAAPAAAEIDASDVFLEQKVRVDNSRSG